MGFMKYANAVIVIPSISRGDWVRSHKDMNFSSRTASKKNKLLSKYNPKDYLLSHCTIIASVDTETPPNTKLGEIKINGSKINRKYSDFYVTADTALYINGNADSWERELLKKTYPTFIGGENYLEHVQVPELSKGKVIDAVARDLGDTIYIDILVATDKRHEELIRDILSKKISALSMGCTVEFTICTKCGNVAYDETDLCPCIKYEKGTEFTDSQGQKRIVAELCGHRDVPGSVVFIEASWVADPAFTGAVLHTILNPDLLDSDKVAGLLKKAFEKKRIDLKKETLRRVASRKVFAQDPEEEEGDFFEEEGVEDEDGGGLEIEFGEGDLDLSEETETPTSYEDLLDDLKDQALKDVWESIIEDVKEEMGEEINQLTEMEDDTLIESRKKKIFNNVSSGLRDYNKFGWQFIRGKFSGLELLLIAKKAGVQFSYPEVKTLLKVGSIQSYNNDSQKFLKKCQLNFNKHLSNREVKRLILGGYVLGLKGMSRK